MKHGLNTDQDSEQGQEESSEVTERGCVTVSNLWLGPCFYPWQKRLSGIPVRRFFSNSLPHVLIRVQSVFHLWQKILPEVTSLDYRMSLIDE